MLVAATEAAEASSALPLAEAALIAPATAETRNSDRAAAVAMGSAAGELASVPACRTVPLEGQRAAWQAPLAALLAVVVGNDRGLLELWRSRRNRPAERI